MTEPSPVRRLVAEFVGAGVLVAVVVGSGMAAQRLSPRDVGLQLLENSTATVFGPGVLILVFASVSSAHSNPVISAADWRPRTSPRHRGSHPGRAGIGPLGVEPQQQREPQPRHATFAPTSSNSSPMSVQRSISSSWSISLTTTGNHTANLSAASRLPVCGR